MNCLCNPPTQAGIIHQSIRLPFAPSSERQDAGFAAAGSESDPLGDMAANFLKKKVFQVLLYLMILPGLLCAFGLVEPRSFVSEEYRILFQVCCGLGLMVSIVIGAILFLWFEDKLGLK